MYIRPELIGRKKETSGEKYDADVEVLAFTDVLHWLFFALFGSGAINSVNSVFDLIFKQQINIKAI